MRTFTVACLAMGLILQVGCASISKMTAHRKLNATQKASAEFLAAKELEDQGKQERARERYEELLAKDPGNCRYMHRLGIVCTRLQRYAEADDYYERAHRREPKNASLLVDMGYSYYLRGDRVEAERWLREAVRLKPNDKRALNNLALVVGRQGKIEECLSLLQRAGDESTALAGLAYIHSVRGEMNLAEQRYREALEKDPKNSDATKALAELSKRRPQEAIVADAMPAQTETVRHAEIPASEFDAPAIQQTGAVVEKGPSATAASVTTANFFEESPEPNEPGLLDESPEIVRQPAARQPVSGKKTTIEFDDEEPFADEVPAATTATVIVDVKPQDDDWSSDAGASGLQANNVGTTTKPTKSAPIKLTSEFDVAADEDVFPQTPSPPAQMSSANRLKFLPSKSPSTWPVAPQ